MLNTPSTETELDMLDQLLLEYGNDDSILDVSELDGFLTAIVSGPNPIMPSHWLPAIWGGIENQPQWETMEQAQQFMTLVMRHMNGIVDGLMNAPERFEALFNQREVDGKIYSLVEEWCIGYVRGTLLDQDWVNLPESLSEDFGAIFLHGSEEGFEILEQMTEAQFEDSTTLIEPAVRKLHAYWIGARS
jgi:uncharacterized protein